MQKRIFKILILYLKNLFQIMNQNLKKLIFLFFLRQTIQILILNQNLSNNRIQSRKTTRILNNNTVKLITFLLIFFPTIFQYPLPRQTRIMIHFSNAHMHHIINLLNNRFFYFFWFFFLNSMNQSFM